VGVGVLTYPLEDTTCRKAGIFVQGEKTDSCKRSRVTRNDTRQQKIGFPGDKKKEERKRLRRQVSDKRTIVPTRGARLLKGDCPGGANMCAERLMIKRGSNDWRAKSYGQRGRRKLSPRSIINQGGTECTIRDQNVRRKEGKG